MKTTQKTILSLLVIAVLGISIMAFKTEAQSDSFVIVRVIECKGGDTGNKSAIYISDESGTITEVELETWNKKNFKGNFKTVADLLRKIRKQGYTLVSSSAGGGDDNGMVMQNYFFEKK